MDNATLDRLAAEKCMGWTYHDKMGVWYLPGANWTLEQCKDRKWSPTTDARDNDELLAAMGDRYDVSMGVFVNCGERMWYATVYLIGDATQFGECDHKSRLVAVTIAALRAKGAEVPND